MMEHWAFFFFGFGIGVPVGAWIMWWFEVRG